jgi:uncharacterized YceG family protein/putative transcription antitermination factor YqgF
MKILGLDVGEKRIGVARVDTSTKIAVPVKTLIVDGSEWDEISKLTRLNNTNFIVLGLPRSNEGNETAQSAYVRQFARNLVEKVPGVRVKFQDESLTSVVAEERLKSRKKKYEKGEIDAEAASIILQDFIESFKPGTEVNDNSGAVKTAEKKPFAKKVESAAENAQALAKKNADKIKLNSKKSMSKAKKWTLFGVPVLLIILGVAGVAIALTIRDHNRAEREAEYARQEAAMKAKTFTFTIRPGETIFDIKKHLLEVNRNGDDTEGEALPNYTEAEIDEAFNATYDYDFLAGKPEGTSLEGYLFGETHEFYGTSTVKDIITKYLDGMATVVSENDLINKYQAQGLSLYEGITLASVVQKESPGPEMATVAQVFLTRLDYGWKLGSDVTVKYALDIVDPERTTYQDNQAALTIDSCYNTRLYTGLPCGPISNPGLTALLAVAEPTDTAYLFFLTGDDGVMYYSYTEAEHNRNAYLHCQTLCNVSL